MEFNILATFSGKLHIKNATIKGLVLETFTLNRPETTGMPLCITVAWGESWSFEAGIPVHAEAAAAAAEEGAEGAEEGAEGKDF